MTKLYNSASQIFKISAFAILFLLGISHTASASHALPIVGLTGTLGPTDFVISGSSDAATCVGTTNTIPYWMQVEITCNPSGFTGAPPVPSSPLWGTAPWFHSYLNIPGPPWNDQCVQEAYNDIVIPLSQLCPGTTYYWRVREFCEPNSVSAWQGPFSFVTPGTPPASVLTATASQYVVCPGSAVQLNAQVSGGCPGGTYVYSWVPTTGLSNPNIQNPVATVNSATTYTVSVSGGCFTITSSDDTVAIGMGPAVAPGTATANPAAVCSGQSSQVVLTGMGSNNIQWQVSPNASTWFTMAGQTDDTLNTGPLTSTLYYHAIVTGSGWPGSGCGTSTSAPTLVTVTPSPVANAGANTTICNGSCANLTGSGGVNYDWQPGNLSGSNVSVCPASTTDYTLTVTDANGCTATDNVTVSISSASTTASPDVSICTGSSSILLASGPSGNTYNWTPNDPTISGANTANPTVTPPTTTTYTVTATNSFGCTATDSVVVTVTAAPPLTVSNDTSMCTGGTATLTVTGATSYTWNPGNFNGASYNVNPSTTTTYTVTGNNNNCLSVDSVTVTINPPPYVFAGPDFDVCAGSQATMNVSTTGSSYTWAPSTGIIGSNTTQSIVTAPMSNTSYTVTVTGPGGCISTDTIDVTVNPIPTVSATSPDNSICTGSSTTVNATGASSYSWIPTTGLSTPTSASSTANPSTTTTYQVIGTDANGCMDTASITVTVNPLPGVYITSTATECGDSTGTMVNSGVVSGTAPFTFTVGSNPASSTLPTNLPAGAYNVITTDANGCTSSQVVTVDMVNTSFVSAAANPTFGTYPLPVGFGASGSSGLTNYVWNFGDGIGYANTQSANYIYTSPGVYTVTLTAWNDWIGCAVTSTVVIEVVEEAVVELPNVFTPNADGTNDGFMAHISGVKEVKVQIFNRWGQEVFEGGQSGLGGSPQDLQLWDGKTNGGNASDDGVYYYVVSAVGFDTKDYSYSGFVHLLKTKPE